MQQEQQEQEQFEITPSDQNFIYEQLSPLGGLFGEEVTCQCPVFATEDDKDIELVPRILVIGKYRVLLIKKEKNDKKIVKKSIHLYDLIEVSEPIINCNFSDSNLVEIKYKDTSSPTTTTTTTTTNNNNNIEDSTNSNIKSFLIKSPSREIEIIIVKTLALTSWSISKGFPKEYLLKINLTTPNRYPTLKYDHDIGVSDGKGIAECYIAHSHYFNTKSTLDYLRHLETLYQTRYPELDLSDIAGIDATCSLGFNLYTGIITLRHNNFIKSLRASSIPHINVTSAIGEMMLSNTTISELHITNLLTEQSFVPIGRFLKTNHQTSLQILNLSNNILSNDSVTSLCDGLANFNHSLLSLNLSGCNIQPKGIALLFDSFQKNFGMSLTLETLILSDNKFQDIGSNAMSNWFNKSRGYNVIKKLVLSNAHLNIGMIAPSIKSLTMIESLDLSKNSINPTSARTLALDGLEGIESTQFKFLNLSSCGLVGESVTTLLIALSRNSSRIKNLTLSLQSNSFANKTALVLIQLLPDCCRTFLKGLDISFNGFNPKQLQDIVQSLYNTGIESLDIGNNLFDGELVDRLVELLKEGKLVKLGLGHQSKALSSNLHNLILGVATSKSLQVLDIIGNELNDHGACILADCLRFNKTLKRIFIGGNRFTSVGWTSLASPFLYYRNTTLHYIDLPAINEPIQINDTSSQVLPPIKRDQLEHNIFSKIRLQLSLNRNKVPQSSRFAYISGSVDPPNYVVPVAQVPEHLLQYCTIFPSVIDQMEKVNSLNNNSNTSNINSNTIKINLNIGGITSGNGTIGRSHSNNNINGTHYSNGSSSNHGGSIRPSLSSLFSKPINLINDIRGNNNNNNGENSSQNNSRVSTPSSWNHNDD